MKLNIFQLFAVGMVVGQGQDNWQRGVHRFALVGGLVGSGFGFGRRSCDEGPIPSHLLRSSVQLTAHQPPLILHLRW
ncbi:hypothetical protein SCA6_009501 [Theobroma cacao]